MSRYNYYFFLALTITILSFNYFVNADYQHDLATYDDQDIPIFSSFLEANTEVEVEDQVEDELDAEAELEAEAEVDAEEGLEEEEAEEVDEEMDAEEPIKPHLDADSSVLILKGKDSAQPFIIFPTSALTKKNPYEQVIVREPQPLPESGWTLRERAAPAPVNVTDVYSKGFCKFADKHFHPVQFSAKHPVREYAYVIVGGSIGAESSDYMSPIITALRSYGVHEGMIASAPMDYNKDVQKQAEQLFKSLEATYNKFHGQEMILITHSNAIVSLHAMLSIYPSSIHMIHGLIAYNPTWGGTALAQSNTDASILEELKKNGFSSNVLSNLSYESRKKSIREYPIDYNVLRILVVASHDSISETNDLKSSTQFITAASKEINNGIVTLSDQLIPGARVITLDNADHFSLVNPLKSKKVTVDISKELPAKLRDPVTVAQSVIYAFFKTTP